VDISGSLANLDLYHHVGLVYVNAKTGKTGEDNAAYFLGNSRRIEGEILLLFPRK
jgi:hypothetical protein